MAVYLETDAQLLELKLQLEKGGARSLKANYFCHVNNYYKFCSGIFNTLIKLICFMFSDTETRGV